MNKINRKSFGFTLIELLTAVAIVGILATIAYPSYVDYVARSNRTEGQRELLRISNLMEQYFLDNRTYTSDLTKLGLPVSSTKYITEPNNYYAIEAKNVSGNGYTLEAAAQGVQATNDSACATLSVNQLGKKLPITDCWE